MKKRVLLLSIDGLGIGALADEVAIRSSDIGSNTLKSILDTRVQLPTFEHLNLLSLENTARPIMYKEFKIQSGKSQLKYRGADSFLGHAEMIGLNLDLKPVYIDDYFQPLQKMIKEYFSFQTVEISNGLVSLDRIIFISNNMECDAGYAINVIIDNTNKNVERDNKIVTVIKEVVPISRVLLIYGDSITYSKIMKSVIQRDYMDTSYNGVAVPLLDIYDDHYVVTHNSNFDVCGSNLLSCLHDKGVSICLIGKPSYLFPRQEYIKIDATDSSTILEQTLKKWTELHYSLLFVNVQDVDLGGHANNAFKCASCMKKLDAFLEKFLQMLDKNDLLLITADHGNDPNIGGRNHTREYVPIIAVSKSIYGGRLDVQTSLQCVANLVNSFFDQDMQP